jgi:carboxypeptidase C (cathepsin A)
MRLFVASGYYDLATPYFATDYTLTHLGLDETQKGRITTSQYEAGHMMYISTRELARLKDNVSRFIQGALAAPAADLARPDRP